LVSPVVSNPFSVPMSFDELKADGASLLASGDVAGAIRRYTSCLPLAPNDDQAGAVQSNLSLCFLREKLFPLARQAAERVVVLRPKWEKGISGPFPFATFRLPDHSPCLTTLVIQRKYFP
jgi:hypothetical protein